ncbi:protein export chaperone SecB [Paludibacter propionicigenes WB4]|uniref:Protein export chaperone SecB n=1 Tax=Paludibacter propionicigenes (strain DSM 17365 / JCM 13257 / WB4) TaxID=694427 RepID=E4T2T9_PALPW|nr:protein-export chaperone SecB [Paludibacter propionicigenes]ADQ79033.1 protein export chaperone SecB [Paludibacter propionicigenes WB4]
MSGTKTSSFQFKGYRIERSVIELKSVEIGENFNISFDSKGIINKSESSYQLNLTAYIKDKENTINIEVAVVSFFSFDSQIEKSQLEKLFYMNAPAIIFPYLRSYITTLTVLSGIDPIILPTLNLSSLGKELEENTTEI